MASSEIRVAKYCGMHRDGCVSLGRWRQASSEHRDGNDSERSDNPPAKNAPRARLGRRALSIMTEMARKCQTAEEMARKCQTADAKNPLPAPAGGGRASHDGAPSIPAFLPPPVPGRVPGWPGRERRRQRHGACRRRRCDPSGQGGRRDCRIYMVCEKVLVGEGRLPSFEVRVRGIIVVGG